MVGTILDIMRLSTEDGPGVRTTVFFKGCTLACAWCHNVESLRFYPQPVWQKGRCMNCLLCHQACKNGALIKAGTGFQIDQAKCAHCLKCAAACPTGAMEVKGRQISAVALANELAKDAAYFGKCGGITLSGGEALSQPDFAAELLASLKARGFHTALDTCGHVEWEAFEKILPHTDLVLYDLKLMDQDQHALFTGAPNGRILENAEKLCSISGGGVAVWIRTPIIPEATDGPENIAAIGAFIREHMSTVAKWELCVFNNLCRSKYQALGLDWAFKEAPLIKKEQMESLTRLATQAWGKQAEWSGAVRLED